MRLLTLFRQVDRDVEKFQSTTGLHCRPGCGHCCENPEVETTVLEMLPVAEQLYKEGSAEKWFDQAQTQKFQGRCVFYSPDPILPGHGRCSVYTNRPVICRLFGFSAMTDKHAKTALVTCSIIKQQQLEELRKTQHLLDEGLPIPVMDHYMRRVFCIDPGLGQTFMPINKALKQAIERVGIYARYSQKEP